MILSELSIGWPDIKGFEIPIDSWFGKSIGFDRSTGESDRSMSAGFIWIDFDGSMDSESLWEDSSIGIVWDRFMEGSKGFGLVWTRSTRFVVKTWVSMVFDIEDAGLEIFWTGILSSGVDT